jgi:competence protein ComEA
VFAHDLDGLEVFEERAGQALDLGGRGVATGEHAEVDDELDVPVDLARCDERRFGHAALYALLTQFLHVRGATPDESVVNLENMRMPSISRGRAVAYVVALLIFLAVAGRFVTPEAGGGRGAARAPAVEHSALDAEDAAPRKVVVHVVGAVREPGLYTLAEGSRIDDAVQKAGGPRPKAALELVNLAAPVADGQQVVVPAQSGSAGAPAAAASVPGAAAGGPVHLNTATLEELDALPGVGPVTAQKILDYRAAKGAFSSVDELDAVPGIGPARLEQLKPLVQL